MKKKFVVPYRKGSTTFDFGLYTIKVVVKAFSVVIEISDSNDFAKELN